MDVKVMRITPRMAERMLESIEINRSVSRRWVSALADQMTAGEWSETGETIKIDEDGHVIDGEHRLRAVIQSGTTIKTLVAYGVQASARSKMDTGYKRSGHHALHLLGVKNAAAVSAALRALVCMQRGDMVLATATPSYQLIDALHQTPGIHDALRFFGRLSKASASSKMRFHGLCVALYYLMSQEDADDAQAFWVAYANGIGLEGYSDPRFALRDKVAHMEGDASREARSKFLLLCIKAWNLWRQRKPCRVLRVGKKETPTLVALREAM